jgi:N-glycosylase/DNA lyase
VGKAREVSREEGGWRPLGIGAGLTGSGLSELLDGGQSFRWSQDGDGAWSGVWGNRAARLRLSGGSLEWAPLGGVSSTTEADVADYLGSDAELAAAVDSLPWRSDAHLARCIGAFPGLRILRQPFGEALLCFMCSSAKRIAQIKQAVGMLAQRFGVPLGPGMGAPRGLPTWERIASLREADLRDCRLGFRARHIHAAARRIASRPGWLEETETLPHRQAHERLCTLPGVGGKIADCALLFGAGRLEAFPVDVWILRAMQARYALPGWRPAQLARFGQAHFGPRAGLAQQYLFAWERTQG